MTFHSYQFIFLALPACYLAFLLAFRIGGWDGAFRLLAVASLAFYALWSPILLAILMASVVANFSIGDLILRANGKRTLAASLLAFGIGGNLLALGYLKYANFLIDIGSALGVTNLDYILLIVPIGVSFYTFIQIGYLIEAHAGQVERPTFWRYILFATFLPCVTAGPLVQQREMLSQMKGRGDQAYNSETLAAGLTMFAMGLFKKVVFADNLQPIADAIFQGAANGQMISNGTAWLGSICYALQLYFDFSGYSDMAVGIGCIFGLKLPVNFDSPFKATNISDFWRRWHMTMTRFFTSYVYTPLAVSGMRSLVGRQPSGTYRYVRTGAIPAIATFFVAGIWHGAGWTFVIYGLIHGLAIAVYLGWSRLSRLSLPAPIGWCLTMSVVVSALVVFRSPDLACATTILSSMWTFGLASPIAADGQGVAMNFKYATSMVVLLGAVVLLMPNSQQILHRYCVTSDGLSDGAAREAGLLTWQPSLGASLAVGTLLCIAIGSIGAGSAFLYYQF